MTETTTSNSILVMFDDEFSIDTKNMKPYKMYPFEYKGTKMWIKRIEGDALELFSE